MTAKTRAFCLLVVVGTVVQNAGAANDVIDLSPEFQPNGLSKVSVELEAGGSTLVRVENEATGAAGTEQRLPMSVSAKLEYMERRLGGDQQTNNQTTPLAVRHYDAGEAVIKVDQSGAEPRLPDDRRLIVVENGAIRPNMYCPHGALTREQLDLVDTVGNSCVIDELLPEKPVADGEAWPSDAAVMGALLTLDSVAVCEVQSVLEEFNASFAKVRLVGVVHGVADGAATEHEVRGVYLFDRRLRRITRLNLAVREQRSIGGATPGLGRRGEVANQNRACRIGTTTCGCCRRDGDQNQAPPAARFGVRIAGDGFPHPARPQLVCHEQAAREHHAAPSRRQRFGRPVHAYDVAAEIGRPANHARAVPEGYCLFARSTFRRARVDPPMAKCPRPLLLRSRRTRQCRPGASRMALLFDCPREWSSDFGRGHHRGADGRSNE